MKEINMIEKQIQHFVEELRPPEEIREKLDVGFTYINNIIEIFEIVPDWKNKNEKIHSPVAKAKYVKTRNKWNIYWRRANGNWERYEPQPEVFELEDFFEILKADKYACFWG